MSASGATACTISVSSTSSPLASHGEAERARLFTTCSRVKARQILTDAGDPGRR